MKSRLLACLLLLCCWLQLAAGTETGQGPLRSLHTSTWTATDGLGRTLPLHAEVGDWRPHKLVCLFYFICYDNTKLLAAAGGDRRRVQYGPPGEPHHWGEPLFGYYLSDDPWVVGKHGSQLADAGITTIVFDMTNADTFDNAWRAVFSGFASMRRAGNPTPDIAVILHTAVNATLAHLFDVLYGPGLYRDLWAVWDGKPLILANASEVDARFRDFFTFRRSWAWTHGQDWFGDGHDAWPWIDFYPQGYGWHGAAEQKEEMPIAVAGWPTLNLGKSYDGPTHSQPPFNQTTPAVGHYFRQQFEWALNASCNDSSFTCTGVQRDDQLLPEAVFITGWNEWIAGRFLVGPQDVIYFCGDRLQEGDTYFVDEYLEESESSSTGSQQPPSRAAAATARGGGADALPVRLRCLWCRYSRDIEAMKGGHSDSYYYQLTAFVRWLTGAERPVSATQPAVLPDDLLGVTEAESSPSSSWWSAVLPVFLDTVNDSQWRSHAGFGDTGLWYADNSTVDDLCEAQLAVDRQQAASSLAFRVAACQAFNPLHSNASTPPPLSLFFLGSMRALDGPAAPPAPARLTLGYQFLLNVTESQLYAADGSGGWRRLSSQPTVKWDSRQLVVTLPLRAVFPAVPASSASSLLLEFKWWSAADWAVQLSDPVDFLLWGDAAPNARFNYRWEQNITLAQQQTQRPSMSEQ